MVTVTAVTTSPYLVKCQNEIGWPLRAAMPMITTFALAPTAVAFPPRSDPSASAHHSEVACVGAAAGIHEVLDDRGQGGDVGDVVDDPGQGGRAEDQPGSGEQVVVTDRVGEPGPDAGDHPDLDQGADHHEQAHEEHQRHPLDLLEVLARLGARDGDQRAGTQQRDQGGLDVQGTVGDEADHHQGQHDAALDEQALVLDDLALVELHHPRGALLVVHERGPEQPPAQQHQHRRPGRRSAARG